jgi:regulator of protease activity HflC (stomatin/prohibitin superfamily)
MQFTLIITIVIVAYLINSIKILKEYERGVIFRLGRVLAQPKGPGIILVFAPIDTIVRVPLRVVVLDVPEQDIITRDNVSAKVNAVVYFRVMDANKAVLEVENYMYATSQLAQTTLRSVVGQATLDDLLSEREKISGQLQEILDRLTDPWGIKVSNVEIKHVDLPEDMKRAMAREAEAERERRAKIISAEGEYQSAEKLVKAAEMMGEHPISVQLRYLETLVKVASDQNTTTLFPIPIDLFKIFFDRATSKK